MTISNVGRASAMVGSRIADDSTSVVAEPTSQLLLLANGSECGFSTGAAPIARLLLESTIRSWTGSRGSSSERLRASLRNAQRPFLDAAESIVPYDDLAGGAAGEIFAACVSHDRVSLAWIGRAEALHIRDGMQIARTRGHTLANDLMSRGEVSQDEISALAVPRVATRVVTGPRSSANDGQVPSEAAWDLREGDVIVIASAALLDVVTSSELGRASQRSDATTMANDLVDLAMSRDARPALAVIVSTYRR